MATKTSACSVNWFGCILALNLARASFNWELNYCESKLNLRGYCRDQVIHRVSNIQVLGEGFSPYSVRLVGLNKLNDVPSVIQQYKRQKKAGPMI